MSSLQNSWRATIGEHDNHLGNALIDATHQEKSNSASSILRHRSTLFHYFSTRSKYNQANIRGQIEVFTWSFVFSAIDHAIDRSVYNRLRTKSTEWMRNWHD